MGGIFLGAFAFITWLLIGGAAILLGGGAFLCLASAIYLFTQIAASGYALFGLGLIALSGFGLFTFASVYWYKKILPTVFRLGQTLRIWITNKKGCSNEQVCQNQLMCHRFMRGGWRCYGRNFLPEKRNRLDFRGVHVCKKA